MEKKKDIFKGEMVEPFSRMYRKEIPSKGSLYQSDWPPSTPMDKRNPKKGRRQLQWFCSHG